LKSNKTGNVRPVPVVGKKAKKKMTQEETLCLERQTKVQEPGGV